MRLLNLKGPMWLAMTKHFFTVVEPLLAVRLVIFSAFSAEMSSLSSTKYAVDLLLCQRVISSPRRGYKMGPITL